MHAVATYYIYIKCQPRFKSEMLILITRFLSLFGCTFGNFVSLDIIRIKITSSVDCRLYDEFKFWLGTLEGASKATSAPGIVKDSWRRCRRTTLQSGLCKPSHCHNGSLNIQTVTLEGQIHKSHKKCLILMYSRISYFTRNIFLIVTFTLNYNLVHGMYYRFQT